MLFLLFNVSFACACDCIDYEFTGKHVRGFYEWADKSFVGNLIYSENDTYKFEVVQAFKGVEFRDTLWGKYNNSCSLVPKEKGFWIVYASTLDSTNNEIDIDACTSSKNLNSNRQYLYDNEIIETKEYEVKKEYTQNLIELSLLQELSKTNQPTSPTKHLQKEKDSNNWLSIIAIILAIISILLNLNSRKKIK